MLKIKLNEKISHQEFQNYFKEAFLKCSIKIGVNLDNLKLIGNCDINYSHIQLSELVNRIQELQNYLSTSTLFLADYSMKSCQKNNNNKLNNKIRSIKN